MVPTPYQQLIVAGVYGRPPESMFQSASEITDIPKLHDRLIAGTARRLRFALITNDPVIQASPGLTTIG